MAESNYVASISDEPDRYGRAVGTAQAAAACRHYATVGEVELGVARQRIRNPAFSETLAAWLDRTIDTYGDRILPVTTGVARRWGQLCARIGHGGADLLIAVTALEHGLSVVTRMSGTSPTGVSIENPFTDAE